MLNIINNAPKQDLLSPVEFPEKLQTDFAQARSSILIRSFLFRNDAVGVMVAKALRGAAERGVKILIIKDRMGAIFEYAEANGQSFLHDEPAKDNPRNPHSLKPLYRYGRTIRTFYGLSGVAASANPFRHLLQHEKIKIIDGYRLNDHSKAVIIDGNIGYVGGINFGAEYLPPESWFDFMLRVEGDEAKKFLFSEDSNLLDEEQLDFCIRTEKEITLIMAFMANKTYLEALTGLVKEGKKVCLITSLRPSSNRFSNSKFLRGLAERTKGHHHNLTVCLKSRMVHAKVILRDRNMVRIGSQNMCVEKGSYNEMAAETNNPNAVRAIEKAAVPSKNDVILNGDSIKRIYKLFPVTHLLPAYMEDIAKSLQLLREKKGKIVIEKARAVCEEAIREFVK
jgi:cardiolipin synthase